jgi:hypothetical protein
MIYASDPLTISERRLRPHGWASFREAGRTEAGIEMWIEAGLVGSAFSEPRHHANARASNTSDDPRLDSAGLVTSPITEDGIPVSERFMLLPAAVGEHAPRKPGHGETPSGELVYYSIEQLGGFRMSPRAVGRAFVEGALEITHWELRLVEGKFRAIEQELKRP